MSEGSNREMFLGCLEMTFNPRLNQAGITGMMGADAVNHQNIELFSFGQIAVDSGVVKTFDFTAVELNLA